MAQQRHSIRFEARSQKENESLEDYVEYFENYCSAIGLDDDDQIRLFLAFINTKSRRRAKLVRHRINSFDDIHTVLLRRGSNEERKLSRRKLENRKWQHGEDFMDYAAACFELANKAFPGDAQGAESLAIDHFTKGLPDILIDRAEQKDSDDIWELAQYISDQSEKLISRGITLKVKSTSRNTDVDNLPAMPQRRRYINEITCTKCGIEGHLNYQCRRFDEPVNSLQERPKCYNCGDDHFTRNCWRHQVTELYPNRDYSKIVTPMETTILVSGNKVKCLVDTGAVASFLTSETYYHFKNVLPQIQHSEKEFLGVTKHSLPLLGVLKGLPTSYQDSSTFLDWFVFQSESINILGLDGIRALGLTIDPRSHRLYTNPIVSSEPSLLPEENNILIKSKTDQKNVRFSETITVIESSNRGCTEDSSEECDINIHNKKERSVDDDVYLSVINENQQVAVDNFSDNHGPQKSNHGSVQDPTLPIVKCESYLNSSESVHEINERQILAKQLESSQLVIHNTAKEDHQPCQIVGNIASLIESLELPDQTEKQDVPPSEILTTVDNTGSSQFNIERQENKIDAAVEDKVQHFEPTKMSIYSTRDDVICRMIGCKKYSSNNEDVFVNSKKGIDYKEGGTKNSKMARFFFDRGKYENEVLACRPNSHS